MWGVGLSLPSLRSSGPFSCFSVARLAGAPDGARHSCRYVRRAAHVHLRAYTSPRLPVLFCCGSRGLPDFPMRAPFAIDTNGAQHTFTPAWVHNADIVRRAFNFSRSRRFTGAPDKAHHSRSIRSAQIIRIPLLWVHRCGWPIRVSCFARAVAGALDESAPFRSPRAAHSTGEFCFGGSTRDLPRARGPARRQLVFLLLFRSSSDNAQNLEMNLTVRIIPPAHACRS